MAEPPTAGAESVPSVLLEVTRDEHAVTRVRLNRPRKANALDEGLVAALRRQLNECAQDGTRALVIEGAGRHFCAGFDFSDFRLQSQGDLVLRFVRIEQMLQLVHHAPFPTVAVVDGGAFGAGADLAAACTYRLGTRAARFRFPGSQFGVVLGVSRLTSLVGRERALELVASACTLDAEQAAEAGLLSRLIDEDDREHATAELVTGLSRAERAAVTAALARATPDTRDHDLAALVRSVAAGGLHDRMETYLSSTSM